MTDPLIVDRLTKRYGSVIALDDMSFSVAPGEIFGFVGSNGAGKSTTMRIVLGVLSADSGRVCWATPDRSPTRGAASDTCPRNAASTRR